MFTDDEKKQITNFQDALGELVDAYLREGLDPSLIAEMLNDEAQSDLFARRAELGAS